MSVPVAAFRANKTKIVGLGVIPGAAFLICLVISLGLLPDARIDSFVRTISGVGVFLFGFLTFILSRQLFNSGIVLEVSEAGIRDTRYSPVVISWSVINNIRLVETSYQEFLSVEFPGDVQAKLPRPWHHKLFDFINPLLGYRGMQISMAGLNGTMGDLTAAINAVAPQRLKSLA